MPASIRRVFANAPRVPLALALAAWLAVPLPARAAEVGDVAAEVVVQALALLGVPYLWGGNDPGQGFDCSGLVRHVFWNVGALELPRRSEEMRRFGASVARTDLRAGDLVFFNTRGRPFSHVAIYVGDGRFVHAPTKNGQVRVDEIEDRYWRTRFNGARRIAPGAFKVAAREPVVVTNWRLQDFPEGP